MKSSFSLCFSVTLCFFLAASDAFVAPTTGDFGRARRAPRRTTSLRMGLDLVTYLRAEWVSASLFTNQTPRSADVALQLGSEDGRVVTFLPRTIREIITSSSEKDGQLTVSARRQLKQQQERRGGSATINYVDQPSDDLRETRDESVDVVVSMQAAAKMEENGLDWKKSIREAARVLKPGGRFLFVEQTEFGNESYLAYVEDLMSLTGEVPENEEERFPIFSEVGYDDVDLVITPHIAGVAVKSMEAGMTSAERAKKESEEEKQRIADLSITAYERGIKKRKKKKKVKKEEEASSK